MKKTNNKYRNNNSNQIYSLNYKFDSISIAGKISGTALDLIKKYNELAKEAHAGGDHVTAEVFRQYAEHYRKIVTDINEKKNAQKVVNFPRENENNNRNEDNSVSNSDLSADSLLAMCDNIPEVNDAENAMEISVEPVADKKEFKVIEITSADVQKDIKNNKETAPKTRSRRTPRKKEVKDEGVAV